MGLFGNIRKLARIWNTHTFISNVKYIIKNDIHTAILKAKDETLEECVFEFDEMRDILLPLIPKILNKHDSLLLLKNNPKSFARFGDGEISIMEGRSIAFQEYDAVLAEKMLQVLKTKRDDLYIGINDYFHAVRPGALELSRMFHRQNITWLRRFFISHTNPEIQYLHAGCFIGYFNRYEQEFYESMADFKQQLFAGRKIAVVTGKSVLAKLDYDVFELASEKIIIEAPSKNAFSAYDSILKDISDNVAKDYLICLILGPTASVMASDLADMGYMAWDIGHLAKDYDVFMKKVEKTSEAGAEFWRPD